MILWMLPMDGDGMLAAREGCKAGAYFREHKKHLGEVVIDKSIKGGSHCGKSAMQ